MRTIEEDRRRETFRQLSGPLLDCTRRDVVQVLLESDGPVSEAELVEGVVHRAAERTGVAARTTESVLRRLYDRDLPMLVENGLAHWNRDDGTVSSTHHPVYRNYWSAESLAVDSLESLAAALGDRRRRELVACFENETGPVTCASLAWRVASREAEGLPPRGLIEEVTAELQQRHLPRLVSVGLVEYDDDSAASYCGPPELCAVLKQRTLDE